MNAETAIGIRRSAPPTSHAVRQIALTPAERKLCTLSRIGYYDAFLVETGLAQSGTGEDWARTILEGAPLPIRTALLAGWSALGLQLGSTPPERFVLGWEVRRSTKNFALLAAGSRLGLPAELLFKRRAGGLFLATLVEQQNPIAQAIWAGVAAAHRRVVPRILERVESS